MKDQQSVDLDQRAVFRAHLALQRDETFWQHQACGADPTKEWLSLKANSS